MYKIKITSEALRSLKKIRDPEKQKIINAIDNLEKDPYPKGYEKLKGTSKPDKWRIRIGIYRVVYSIRKKEITLHVTHIGKRKEIYKYL